MSEAGHTHVKAGGSHKSPARQRQHGRRADIRIGECEHTILAITAIGDGQASGIGGGEDTVA